MIGDRADVVVIGAGHAGCEAALAAARLGHSTVVICLDRGAIGHMACNPSIGGPAKGQLVREIDALGGEIGRAADDTALQYRTLNQRKGPAVQATRTQNDRQAYQHRMRTVLEDQDGLELVEGEAAAILADGEFGVELVDGRRFRAGAVIVTTGTFLGGLCHCGARSWAEGRHGEPPATRLSASLASLGLTLGRLKTGTPARLDGASLDLSGLEEQPGDPRCQPFSLDRDRVPQDQIACHISHTSPEIHALLRENLDRSPLYSGRIKGLGPRYCPSIEDKVVRFPDRQRHQVFLEPEDRDRSVVYPSGISSSMPADVQEAMIRAIPGLEGARILRLGYAVEYDFVPPTQLEASLMVRRTPGLFLAGQVNGSSGYEEAAGQGLLAGINAVQFLRGTEPVVLKRSEAYLGILADDLTTRGTQEPYRMLTSRAEHRLLLREDNADLRLRELGHRLGLVDAAAAARTRTRQESIDRTLSALESVRVRPDAETSKRAERAGIGAITQPCTLLDLLRRPASHLEMLRALWPDASGVSACVARSVEIEAQYSGYIERQQREVARLDRLEQHRIPADLDFPRISGLSREVVEKLVSVRPQTLGQAARVPGVTPAAITRLVAALKARERNSQ